MFSVLYLPPVPSSEIGLCILVFMYMDLYACMYVLEDMFACRFVCAVPGMCVVWPDIPSASVLPSPPCMDGLGTWCICCALGWRQVCLGNARGWQACSSWCLLISAYKGGVASSCHSASLLFGNVMVGSYNRLGQQNG